MKHIISLGAGVQSSTMALMAAHGEITPMPLFDLMASIEARDKGMSQAATNKASLLKYARMIAVEVAKRKGEVTADDVVEAMVKRGYSPHCLGNATGSLFRAEGWQWTGRRVKSRRIYAHSNELKSWIWKG